jgi:hypothetical protein
MANLFSDLAHREAIISFLEKEMGSRIEDSRAELLLFFFSALAAG